MLLSYKRSKGAIHHDGGTTRGLLRQRKRKRRPVPLIIHDTILPQMTVMYSDLFYKFIRSTALRWRVKTQRREKCVSSAILSHFIFSK